MKDRRLHSDKGFFRRYGEWLLAAVAVVLTVLSVTITRQNTSLPKETAKLQKNLRLREKKLEKFVRQTLAMPDSIWLSFNNLPEDMVIYRYSADTLQSWVGEFPVDTLDELATAGEQYLNVGNSWYVVKKYVQDDTEVLAGVLVKNTVQGVSEKLKLGKGFDIEPLSAGEEFVVYGRDGGALFSLVEDISVRRSKKVWILAWLAIAFAFLAAVGYFLKRRTLGRFGVLAAVVTALRLICYKLASYIALEAALFSPKLYADSGIFPSLGDLLLNNLYVTVIAAALFALRYKLKDSVKRWLMVIAVPLLCLYIHFTLKSLITNSSIVLELYRVTELNVYSILCYVSYGLMFLALLCSLQVAVTVFVKKRRRSLLTYKSALAFVFLCAIYTLFMVSYLSYNKEKEWSYLAANKLVIDRDLSLELELRRIEKQLARDPVTAVIMVQPKDNISLLEQRFSELYFQNIRQKYNIHLTVCRQHEAVRLSQRIADCQLYYEALLDQYRGEPIAELSSFYYLNNYAARVGYLGVFKYYTESGPVNLYIEINSRFADEPNGYPSGILGYAPNESLSLPVGYSYAKYYDNRLLLHDGRYDYPTQTKEFTTDEPFSVVKEKKYIHFVHKLSPQSIVVLSRERRSWSPYVISLSYLMLFFSGIFFFIIRLVKRGREKRERQRLKTSFKKQIISLTTAVLTVSLGAAGLGSVYYSINYYVSTNRTIMEEKIQTVQKSLAQFCMYVQDYEQINSNDILQAMTRLAGETHADINIYNPQGLLTNTTKPELFTWHVLPYRMNSQAYYDIVVASRSQVFNKEKMGRTKFYALYSPVFNVSGKLIAIVNIPYFANNTNLTGDISSVVAAIINVSIILLILALFFGRLLATSVTWPLSQISKKMLFIDVTNKPEHINYKRKDELGVLVDAYNQMVDSLAESTKQMALAERQKAWSDMARRIAHEIKNPLTPMKLSIQRLINLKRKNASGWQDKLEDISNSILEQIDILSNTASEFSSYAKFFVEDNAQLDLHAILREQKVLFDNADDIRLSLTCDLGECWINARKGQIIRVIVNLISNAIQAVEGGGGMGYILVSLRQKADSYVVSVEDNGSGVNEADVEKLFTPNFTTKSSGNGLGLAISKSIIEQSGGRIWYSRSELGGACFAFSLPKIVLPTE